jgi:hypothetical protein
MRKIYIFYFLVIFYSLNAQNVKLNGVWILDKILYKNGNPLEINHPMYSEFMKFEFNNNKMKISSALYDDGNLFDIVINEKQISNKFRVINYEFKNDLLFLNDVGDDKIMIFIRKNKFVDTYPEFAMSKILFNNKEVYIPNYFNEPQFNYVGTIYDFIENNTPSFSKSYLVGDLELKFILTIESKIEDIEISTTISKKLEEDLKKSLIQAEKWYENNTGKNLLIVRSYSFTHFSDKPNTLEKKIKEHITAAHNFYEENDFKKAIVAYNEAIELKLNNTNNTNNINLYHVYISLGISYLAENEIDLACECFRKNGNITNFDIRNYLINFCKKED